MKKVICLKCEEEKEHHSKNLCRQCYDWERNRSQNKSCEGCQKTVTNDSRLCKSCCQKARLGTLTKKIKSGTGQELWVKWEDGRWTLLHPSSYEAEQIRRDLASQLVVVHQKP